MVLGMGVLGKDLEVRGVLGVVGLSLGVMGVLLIAAGHVLGLGPQFALASSAKAPIFPETPLSCHLLQICINLFQQTVHGFIIK